MAGHNVRMSSWIGVAIMVVGAIVIGIGAILLDWPMIIAGIVVGGLGGLVAVAGGIMEDVT